MDILLEFYVEAYKKGLEGLIPIGSSVSGDKYYLTDKQRHALSLLRGTGILFVGYGGGARSGKSVLECFWILFNCLSYPGVGYGLCRRELTVLKKTVLRTMFMLFSYYSMKDGIDFKYHEQKNLITFPNGSEIFLIDMAKQPSDPLYTRFGGLELTGAAIDESNESDYDGIGTLFGRCGWRMNEDYGLEKKVLETFNPDKGHIYSRYYKPFRDGNESDYIKFIPALPTDNPHPAARQWVDDVLKEGNVARIERLINGNFDWDTNPDILCSYDAICDIFVGNGVEGGKKYISADLAMMGRDRFVASVWDGLNCVISVDKGKATGKEIEQDLRKLMLRHGISNRNVVADADGLGNYLESYIRNIKTFRGNKRAINKDFDNIKSECAFKLAEYINNRKIHITCSQAQEDRIKRELSICLRRDNLDIDTQKKKLIKKPQMVSELGFSPDYFDNLMMRMVFELRRFSSRKFTVRLH